jgi:transcription elongation factor GreA
VTEDVVMTAEDAAKLESELRRLQTNGRQEIAKRIKTAREWGDLKENAEYHDAKNDQAKLETEILRLRDRRSRAEIREAATATDIVGFGSRVEVVDRADGRAHSFVLVASTEAKPAEGRLAFDSPIGQALNGASLGQVVSFATPKGERTFEITTICGG